MFISSQRFRNCVFRELAQDRLNMDQAIRIAIQEDNRRDDIFGWESRGSVRTHCRSCDGGDEVVVIHLERSVPHNLKPMHDGLDRSK